MSTINGYEITDVHTEYKNYKEYTEYKEAIAEILKGKEGNLSPVHYKFLQQDTVLTIFLTLLIKEACFLVVLLNYMAKKARNQKQLF